MRGQGLCPNEPVDVVIRPEDIDIVPPEQGHLCGNVTSVTFKGVHYDTIVDFKGFKWLIQTTDYCPVDAYIGIRLNPEDIHIMHKSEYPASTATTPPTARNMTRLPTPRRKKTMKNNNKLARLPVHRLDDPVYDHPAGYRLLLRADRFDYRSVHAGQPGWHGHLSADFPALDLAESVRLAYLPGDRLSGGLFHRAVQAAHAAVSRNAHHAAHVHELSARTLAWVGMLEDTGIINTLLQRIGIGPAAAIRTNGAVILGMVYNYLPYKILLPLYTVIMKIDNRLIEAALDLGCRPSQVFSKVILPLSGPGILSGLTMVFVPAVSTFYISQKLGSTGTTLIGDVIESQFKTAYNPNLRRGHESGSDDFDLYLCCCYESLRRGRGEEVIKV